MLYYKYNIRSINRYQFAKKEKTCIKFISRINKKNNMFKYVWFAMFASKSFNSERDMRLEKEEVYLT